MNAILVLATVSSSVPTHSLDTNAPAMKDLKSRMDFVLVCIENGVFIIYNLL